MIELNFSKFLPTEFNTEQLAATIGILTLAFTLRWLSVQVINRSSNAHWDVKRQWRVNVNSILTFLAFISLTFIWANELQTLALSFVAFAVAFVIAAKEVLSCIFGGIFRTNNSFKIGDRIEVKGIRGDVIDKTLLSTKILEIGPGQTTHQYTGRSVVVPNNIFLSEVVINESFLGNFVLHPFTISLRVNDDWRTAEKILLRIAHEECSIFYEEATDYLDRVQRKANLETPSIHPRVHVRVVDVKTLQMIVRVTIPAYDKGKIEQAIIKRFLDEFRPYSAVIEKPKT